MKKLSHGIILLILFVIVFVANSFLITLLYDYNQKTIKQKQILAELELLNANQNQFDQSVPPMVLGAMRPQINLNDARVINLQKYLRKYNSPLYDYADKIVYYSDQYNLDYRLLVAIAGQESTFCRFIPHNSYNCWGWGIYGDNVIRFSDYEEGIKTVAKGIKENYVDKGLITTEEIMKIYTPSSKGSWSSAIRYFFHHIEKPE